MADPAIDIQKMREFERRYTRLAEAERLARLGSWNWDVVSGKMTCSAGLFEIYGISANEFDETYEVGNSKYVHPDDRALVEEEMRQALETGAPVDFAYRIIRPDGRVRRLHSRAELIADADGTPLRLIGTAQDVTELHAAADSLHQTGKADLVKLLSPRQIEILALVADGLSNSEIASRLYLGESTVKWHVRKILKALGVTNRAQAVARYLSGQAVRR